MAPPAGSCDDSAKAGAMSDLYYKYCKLFFGRKKWGKNRFGSWGNDVNCSSYFVVYVAYLSLKKSSSWARFGGAIQQFIQLPDFLPYPTVSGNQVHATSPLN